MAVAIVPLDNHADMDRIMTLFFDTRDSGREARDNRAIRIRVLFDNVNVLIGDFDECSGPRREWKYWNKYLHCRLVYVCRIELEW